MSQNGIKKLPVSELAPIGMVGQDVISVDYPTAMNEFNCPVPFIIVEGQKYNYKGKQPPNNILNSFM